MNRFARKLPPQSAERLRKCPIQSVSPYALMPAPTYVFMPKNHKFVSVKSPLDFFSPEELKRLEPFGSFYVPDFVEKIFPFRTAGMSCKRVLTWTNPDLEISLAPFELSDAILRMIAPLWGSAFVLDAFCATVFCNEFFESIPESIVRRDQELDIEQFELALFRSSVGVFLALHLGYCDRDLLTQFRDSWFSIDGKPRDPLLTELKELMTYLIPTHANRVLRFESFFPAEGRMLPRLVSRLARIRQAMLNGSLPSVEYDQLLEELCLNSA